MLIPVTFNPPGSQPTPPPKLPMALAKVSHDEVVLIELQGALEVEVTQPTDKNGKFVGKLTIDENGSGKPTLMIGHHLLEGNITPLTKPLAILTRITADAGSRDTNISSSSVSDAPSDRNNRGDENIDMNAMDCDDDGGDSGTQPSAIQSQQAQWEAVGIVKRKIVFSKRPMPIVGRLS
ncbi:hypothetical protein P691DRAFT_800754 [Macrolepiota fuliginosa MF-IS2]|uniref:Chromosome transmission fidelity protein 8 n=1 Tax=Macrolepiota fuliginosa MF-IS2 TaxID=1400762 RepID=A0A9P5XL60_9AGAR|nr:hypothetical protein P691DRAFT_800754 [Macrolepiota fuliginosa MF-IS2]